MECRKRDAGEAVTVNVENFRRVETNRMFFGMVLSAGGVNHFHHETEPIALDSQNVIRMNRDTLYSGAVVDITKGATFTLPDGGDRYVSIGIYNQDNYVNRVYHTPGTHELTMAEFDTPMSRSSPGCSSTPPTRMTSPR